MPSLLDPPDDRRFQPLLIQPPDEPPPDTSWSDALAETYRTVSDELARQQQISAERGLWTGGGLLEGGHPTAKGVVDAASQTAQGVLMGSTAPGAPRPVSRMPDLDVGERGMMAVPSLRSMAPADASVAAAAEPHLIPTSGGDGYVGAPSWVQTPEHIQQMRANLDTAIDAGAEGREWYGRTRDWTSEITGSRFDPATGEVVFGSPTDARNTAEGLAVFSPQSNPDTNLQFFLQARNAYERGQPVAKARTGQQAQTYNEGMAAKEQARAEGQPEPDIRQGPKTGPFAWHMSPDRPYGTTGVNDIWHARSFGYTNPDGSEFSGTPNEQQHKFMDYETVLAIDRANARASGGFTDWNAATVQAAPWVANKEANLRRRYPNWTDEEIRQEAHSSFPEVAGGATAYMPHEQVPGKSTGLLDLLPESEKGPFSAASTWRDPVSGRDMLTGNMFLQQRMPDTTGTYMNSAGQLEMNPAQTARPLVDFLPKDKGSDPRQVHPGTESALTGSSYVRGLLDLQEGTPWHYIDTTESLPVRETSSMRLTGQRPTPEQLEQLQNVADKHGYFLSDTGDGVSLINAGRSKADTPEGSLPSPAGGIEQKARLQGGMAGEINQAIPGATLTPGRASGNYADLTDELALSAAGQGRATDKVLGELNDMQTKAPRMYESLVNSRDVATKAQANLDRLTPEMRAARPDYANMLQIIAGGNIKGLQEHVLKYGSVGLPAILAALAASGSKRQPES